MDTIAIRHSTLYRYDRPVEFGPHRLLIRPRDGHDMRILDSSLRVSPDAEVSWSFDTYGNSVAALRFHEAADRLYIESELTVRRYGPDDAMPRLSLVSASYPFSYDSDDRIDLAPLLALEFPEEGAAVAEWLDRVMPTKHEISAVVLNQLSSLIHTIFAYGRREMRGVQSPARTIDLGAGTCRDFALLFIEAARNLGFAARFVTGYLHDPGRDAVSAVVGGGATHAWADVFLPGAGWVEFDPTNRIVAGRNLIRVAATRTPRQALPMSGVYFPNGASFLGMNVEVEVGRVA